MPYVIPEELADATAYLYHHHRPWMTYSMLVPLTYKIVEQKENDLNAFKACTYGSTIAFSSWFAGKLRKMPQYLAYVIAHEIAHQQLMHHVVHARWAKQGYVTGRMIEGGILFTFPFVGWIAQHAWDFQINDGLNMTGMKPPEDALINPAMGTFWDIEEDIYVRYYAEQCRQQGVDPSQNDRTLAEPTTTNVMHDVMVDAAPDDRFDADQRRANAFEKMLDAIETDKLRGDAAMRLQKLFQRKTVRPLPWYEIIRPSCESALGGPKPTWNRVNRPAFAMGYVLQGSIAKRSGTVCVVLDTSASMSADETAACVEHLIGLFSKCLPKELHVLEVDTTVQRATLIKHPRELRQFIRPLTDGAAGLIGNGGTILTAAHDWLIEKGVHPDVTLYFTDMGTNFPSSLGNSKRVYWISTMPHLEAPGHAGVTLRMTLN